MYQLGAEDISALTQTSPNRHEALERLVEGLLFELGRFPHRATDGVVLLRDEATQDRYFGVGKVFMIRDSSVQPLWVELEFDHRARSLESGQVHLAVSHKEGRRLATNKPRKVENLLLGYPHEAVSQIPWAYAFVYRDGEWVLRGSSDV